MKVKDPNWKRSMSRVLLKEREKMEKAKSP